MVADTLIQNTVENIYSNKHKIILSFLVLKAKKNKKAYCHSCNHFKGAKFTFFLKKKCPLLLRYGRKFWALSSERNFSSGACIRDTWGRRRF